MSTLKRRYQNMMNSPLMEDLLLVMDVMKFVVMKFQ